jgi:hypothetical protein
MMYDSAIWGVEIGFAEVMSSKSEKVEHIIVFSASTYRVPKGPQMARRLA